MMMHHVADHEAAHNDTAASPQWVGNSNNAAT